MFSAKDIYPEIKVEDMYSKISEYDIFKKYCPHFKEIDIAFHSEFYEDKSPDCYISQDKNNKLFYKDFGQTDHRFSCLFYVMFKYSCTYREVLLIISNDFGLFNGKNDLKPSVMLGKDTVQHVIKPKVKSTITIKVRNWNNIDYNYWSKYGIDFAMLDAYDVFPCSNVYLHKGERTVIFNYSKDNPMYAYRFTYDGKYSYKIYKPLSPEKKYKWLFSGGVASNIEGFDQLPLFGDLLILQKSLKDIMCTKLCGYTSISLQGEANRLEQELVNKLLKRFKSIIIMYDNDEQGIKSAKSISQQYGFKSIIIPLKYECKDLSELIVKIGLKEAKTVLNKLINDK